MFRSSVVVSLLVAGMTTGCANVQPVLTGGYYCMAGTELSCASHEGSGDCQPCPRSTATPLATAATPATPVVLPGRPD
jgi:hypothetical protein